MLFNSYVFLLVFLPTVLTVYLLLVRQGWRHRSFDWLVVASIFFYGWWRWSNVPLLLGSLIFNYMVGTWLGKRERCGWAKAGLALGVTANLLFLGYFKYSNFFIENANWVLGSDWTMTRVVLPLGISFFTFQEIAYLVDSYNGLARNYGFRDFSLFVSFFPQLIAGPIVHHGEVMPQFRQPHPGPSWEDLSVGGTLFVLGLAKKVLVADSFGSLASPLFGEAGAGASVGFAAAWLGVLAYSMQIYFDFSAYSDMTLGLGRLFGIRLPMNFNSPYKAVNIVDFWRRWHMTLSRFLRDYLYIPLGGNRRGPSRRYVNLMLTMLLGGLWHGAGWNFVIWGGLHGCYLLGHHAWRAWRQGKAARCPSPWGLWMGRLVTFLSVLVAWVFFRAESTESAFGILSAMAGMDGYSLATSSVDLSEAGRWVVVFVLVVWFFPNSHEMLAGHEPTLEYQRGEAQASLAPTPGWLGRRLVWQPNIRWALFVAALFAWTILNLSRPSEFIYWQF